MMIEPFLHCGSEGCDVGVAPVHRADLPRLLIKGHRCSFACEQVPSEALQFPGKTTRRNPDFGLLPPQELLCWDFFLFVANF